MENSLARRPGTTRDSTKHDARRRKSSLTKPTAARASGRNAAQHNGTSDEQGATLTSAQKRQPRTSLKQASSQPAAQRRQAEPGKTVSSAPEQRIGRGSKISAMLGSPVVRNVVAAGLVSAAAALIYRKPRAIAAANESVQEAATELFDDAVDAARATTKAARKVKRKAVAAVEAVATSSASATQDTTTARPASGSSLEGASSTEVAGTTAIQQRMRKRRSDAGMKRGSKTSAPSAEAPISSPPEPSTPPVSLETMETSAFAFSARASQPPVEAAPALNAADEQAAEARPS